MTTDRESDLRNACKLIIGRQRDIPWRDVPDSDVDGYVDELRKLDPPAPTLPDVRPWIAELNNGVQVLAIMPEDQNGEQPIWYEDHWRCWPADKLSYIRPLHANADELRATVDQLTDALRQSTQARLDDSAKHVEMVGRLEAERDELRAASERFNADLYDGIVYTSGSGRDSVCIDDQEQADLRTLAKYAREVLASRHAAAREGARLDAGRILKLERQLAARPADRELLADVESLLDSMIASDPEGFGFGFMPEGMSARELLARVRQARDPKPPAEDRELMQCVDRFMDAIGYDEWKDDVADVRALRHDDGESIKRPYHLGTEHFHKLARQLEDARVRAASDPKPSHAAALLRDEADMYCKADGTPGVLANVWGWRVIADKLREIASRVERSDPKPPMPTTLVERLKGPVINETDTVNDRPIDSSTGRQINPKHGRV